MYKFSGIYGHEIIINSLEKALETGAHAHAYIIDGISGIGKTMLSGIFSRALNCAEKIRPCNECTSCKASLAFNHPDIIYVKAKGAALGVSDIREQVNSVAHIRPYGYSYKIFILEQADKMTVQAQNALLKTLEEPPSYAVFLLISENSHNFLPTIVSRCVSLKLRPLTTGQVRSYLLAEGYDASLIPACAAASGGSIGRAIALAKDETYEEERKELQDILNSLPDSSLWDILLVAKRLEKFKDRSERMLDFMHLWYRDALVHKAVGGEGSSQSFIRQDLNLAAEDFSRKMPLKKLISGADSLVSAGHSLRANGNYLLTMEIMLMKMAGY